MQYFVLHKPRGCITARADFEDRPLVYDHVPPHYPRLPHVGRLDFNTEGLLLFTDDGRLGQALTNPGFSGEAEAAPVEKVYEVKVRGVLEPDDHRIELLGRPLAFNSGHTTAPARVRLLRHRSRATWLEVVLTEGRNRQIRRLCERSGLQVVKLRRVAIGPLLLGDLPPRWCRPLTEQEVAACYAAALPGEAPPVPTPIDDSPAAYALAKATAEQ
jgi:23S rRNA pseudouridine2605 synthase